MSKLGKIPIAIPEKVKVSLDQAVLTVEGPLGRLSQGVPPEVAVEITDGRLMVVRTRETRKARVFQGLIRSLTANMVKGVSDGFQRTLEIIGVGYRAEVRGSSLVLSVGYSQPVEYQPRPGIKVDVERATRITVRGIDKQLVGQTAAEIRAVRKPEPYKGKGIKYVEEKIRRKVGKAGAK